MNNVWPVRIGMTSGDGPLRRILGISAAFFGLVLVVVSLVIAPQMLEAGHDVRSSVVGDPQLRTDHPWFPGELSCSTFQRLFETQAELYRRKTGRDVATEEDKVIASWYWRNLNYYHAYCPREPFWGDALTSTVESPRDAVLDYWTGLFGYGFSLCYTTHQQYTAEMQTLLGHGRARSVDVDGHTSFEVFLKDAPYGPGGDWALLDQDISTVVFDDPTNPKRLVNLSDIVDIAHASAPAETDSKPRSRADLETFLDNSAAPYGNRGWFKSGLYFPQEDASDATNSDAIGVYTNILGTAPLSGYAGVPPIVSIKQNETIRRYLQPGLGDKTYVYWGPNYLGLNKGRDAIPGPSRDRTWATQPERMHGATRDTDQRFARYGNVVYTYRPNFTDGTYRDGVIAEDERSVTFYFYSPYAIAATPPRDAVERVWGIHSAGCTNGLVVSADRASESTLQVSTDNGSTWSQPLRQDDRLDLTDLVKGHHSYHLRFNARPGDLANARITMRTVCMANDRLMPHLKAGGTSVSFGASGKAVFAAGPNVDQAGRFVTSGGFGTDQLEMRVPTPNGAPLLAIHAAAIVNSGTGPDESIGYQIDCSTDDGATWRPIVDDWRIETIGYQAGDRAPMSFCFGEIDVSESKAAEVIVRFSNDGGVTFERTEVYLVYRVARRQPVIVTFNWNEQAENRIIRKTSSHTFEPDASQDVSNWKLETGEVIQTNWVEMKLAR